MPLNIGKHIEPAIVLKDPWPQLQAHFNDMSSELGSALKEIVIVNNFRRNPKLIQYLGIFIVSILTISGASVDVLHAFKS